MSRSPNAPPFLKIDEIDPHSFDRRSFLAGSSAFVVGLFLAGRGAALADSTAGGLSNVQGGDATPSLFIAIEEDGTVRLTCHRSEMGQQVWTAMAQLLADELEADWSRVVIDQALGHPRYGDQNTDGSRSVRNNFTRLRTAGAAMRLMLERAAAQRWKVRPRSCRAELGAVVHTPSKRRLGFGELAAAAQALPMPRAAEVKLKPRSAWRYIGKPVPSLTVPKIVRGEGTFGIDVQIPDMLHAVIARPPQVLGGVERVDDRAALAIAGVVQTVELPAPSDPVGFQPLGGVAVVARDTWSAIKGREALDITWSPGPNASYDSQRYAEELMKTANQPGDVRRKRGDVGEALAASQRRISADYYMPHLAHSTMAPPAVAARWNGDEVECWGGVQAPQAARQTVAAVCGVPEDKVTIHVSWLGGGFGRKSKPDFFAEAALVARAARAPVKVTWTREDDLRHGYYHTVSAQHIEAGLDQQGRCTAFLHRTVFPPIASIFQAGADKPGWGDLRLGASDTPFAVPNLQLETGDAPAHLRIGWLRSVANIYHAFAVQSFACEMAHAAGRDPKDYLLELIGPPRTIDPNSEGATYDNYGSPLEVYPIDTGRLSHVTRVAAEMAGWGRELPAGHGLGIAAHRSFLSYVATVVEVAVDERGQLSIPGVWSAMDAGTVVNPRHAASQLEGGTLFGLSNALYGEITARGGAVVQDNFPAWRVMRMNEAPRHMEVHLVPSEAPPGGVGEPPTPPAAPALANAIFAATGERIRRLPIFAGRGPDRLPNAARTTNRGGA
ncbi:xanthine dehydrogenase family protein molybdopterin-binding subunit [Haliangium ochraceum]|uniref:Aldehyde oxidase and xanthine dehydrogenase molybdopterin binding protein n=1 Tax=Haliangium ochraceum (strain DSM 14365 / JCM 11303 / SMP-2) TaxID=502025 RepID=D0LQ01_HALO1|nr:molybdopterin cofactor-binding domain-containing protein [Haliangium ochraceum]ACY17038.1 aldehyde oxidase and xanthine dehydrogenase molybdopterin binding protein [Haliangium ochraceum DSM 14365]